MLFVVCVTKSAETYTDSCEALCTDKMNEAAKYIKKSSEYVQFRKDYVEMLDKLVDFLKVDDDEAAGQKKTSDLADTLL